MKGWFKQFFDRKHELVILSFALIAITLLSKYIAINHWESLGYEVTGYHPYAPFLVMAWAGVTMGILYIRRIRSLGLWGMALISFAYGMLMFWMLWLK